MEVDFYDVLKEDFEQRVNNLSDQQFEKLEELLIKYNINLSHIDLMTLVYYANCNEEDVHEMVNNTEALDLAKLHLLLLESIEEKKSITISTTIKGLEKSVEFNYPMTNTHILMLISSILNELSDYSYKTKLNIEQKEKVTVDDIIQELLPDYLLGFSAPYTIDEITRIIELENRVQKGLSLYKKRWISIRISPLVEHFKKTGIFDNSKKTIKTNEACFLYDVLDLLGAIRGDISANNNEKYQFIKKELKK